MSEPTRSARAAAWLRRVAPAVFCDTVGLSGMAGVSYGAWLIYQPAGFIAGGWLLIAFAYFLGRRLN